MEHSQAGQRNCLRENGAPATVRGSLQCASFQNQTSASKWLRGSFGTLGSFAAARSVWDTSVCTDPFFPPSGRDGATCHRRGNRRTRTGVSYCLGCQALCHGRWSLRMALRMVRSFLATAMRATILGLPVDEAVEEGLEDGVVLLGDHGTQEGESGTPARRRDPHPMRVALMDRPPIICTRGGRRNVPDRPACSGRFAGPLSSDDAKEAAILCRRRPGRGAPGLSRRRQRKRWGA
jgi:hypothetical protein